MIQYLRKIWRDYILLGTTGKMNKELIAKISLMNQVYLFCWFGLFISFVLRLGHGLPFNAYVGPAVTTFIFTVIPFFSYFRKHKIGWHTASLSILLSITISGTVQPTCYANYLLYSIILFLILFLFNDNKKAQNFYLVFIALNVIAFTYLISLPAKSSEPLPVAISMVIVIIAIIFNYIIFNLSMKYRVKREQKLAYAISLKNAALNATKDASTIVNRNGKITGYNQQYLELWGIEEKNIKNLDVNSLLKKCIVQIKNDKKILEKLIYLSKNPSNSSFDILEFKDGRIIESHSQPQILNQEVVGRVYNYRDVTEKYRADKILKENKQKLQSLFENSPLGIVVFGDYKDPFRIVNKKFCELVGYTYEELNTMSMEELNEEGDFEIHKKLYWKERKKGKNNFTVKNKFLRKDGQIIWVRLNFSLVRNEENKLTQEIMTVEDMTDQIEKEARIQTLLKELKSLNEELEQKVKLRTIDLKQTNNELTRANQDLDQCAYMASHDLQEPLRMVGNFVQLLERQYTEKIDDEGKEYINYIVDGVSRMSKLIQNLLKYSRVGRKESALRTINLERIVEAKLFGLKQKIAETSARVELNNLPQEIFCEPDQIGMVFYNLITNALKFNKTSPSIKIGFKEEIDQVKFHVKDNGIGIDKRYETKVFEIFKRLHRREEYEGTGIGLALCKKIVARHGGKIWFESEPNKGTTFYFTISKRLNNEKHVPVDTNLVSRR